MALRRNILLFHSAALGDFIVTWPLAIALARLHPQSRVFYITQGEKGKLAERVLRIESLDVDSGGWHRLFSQSPDLPAPAARILAGAHTIISFMAEPDDQWSQNVQAANPDANLLAIHSTPADDFAGHQAEYLADQLHPWPAVETAAKQILHSVAERGLGAGPTAAGPIIIHPGGGAAKKCWPAERYVALAERLRGENREVRVLLGEVELERFPAEVIASFRAVADVQTPHTLPDLLTQISAGSAFVGNDSGPGHLAGILGMPTLSLFGQASRVDRWKPLGPRVQVVHKPLGEIDTDEVFEQVIRLLEIFAVRSRGVGSHDDD